MSRTVLRIALKRENYTAINPFGLTLGITCSLFLLLHIVDELSYDKRHANAENIFRMVTNIKEPEDEYTQEFSYRISLINEAFASIVASVPVIMLAMVTVVYHSAKAANANPITSHRTE